MTRPFHILVLGGTGFIGRSVCERLVERANGASGRIVVPTRNPHRARYLQMLPTVELVRADLHDDATLARLVAGCDAVINLVAILHGSEAAFEKVHVELPRRLARACAAAGVRRVVHVSAIGAATDAPSRYQRSKAAGEAVLKDAHLALTVLRPSVVFGEHDRFINLFASLQALLPVMALAGAEARFQPVWVEDVAAAIVRALDDTAMVGGSFECAGPEVFTLRQLVAAAGRWSGHPRPIIGLPLALGRLQAALLELLPGTPLMSRDNVDSMRIANVATPSLPGLAALGIVPSALPPVMQPLLEQRNGVARLEPYRRGAGR